jgi:hypothetical protein
MHRKLGPALLAGSLLAVGAPMVAYAAPTHYVPPSVKLCVVEGGGDLVLSGPTTYETAYLRAPITGTDNLSYSSGSSGTGYGGTYTVDATQPNCKTVPGEVQAGDYTVYAAGKLDGPCYRTVNGDLVNPPYIVGATSNADHTPRCPGKVYDITLSDSSGRNPSITVRHQDQLTFHYYGFTANVITFRITDKRLFDCVSQTGGQGAAGTTLGSANDSSTVCEPNGPTANPPA